MKTRFRVNRGKDRKIFSATARKTKVQNIPGKVVSRGGIRL